METYAAAGILGLVMSLMTVWVGWYVLTLVARWRIFDKAGIAGWKSLIPIYSDYCTYKIAWKTSFFWAMLVLGGVAGFIANRMGVYTDAGETEVGKKDILIWVDYTGSMKAKLGDDS